MTKFEIVLGKKGEKIPRDTVEEYAAKVFGDPCILCGKRSQGVGVYEPKDPAEFGAPHGKTKFYMYPLCDNCYTDQGAVEVENRILAEIKSSHN